MPSIELPFGSVFYREKGEGAALVMIMGTGADHTSWARQVPVLSRAFRVLTPDNRGSGRSVPAPPPDATTEDFARETLALLDHLAIERFHLVGFSFGSAVASAVAVAAPARVIALSLHAGWAGPNPATTPALERSLARVREEGVVAFLVAACERNFSPTFRESDPLVWQSFLKNVANSVTRPSLEGVLAQAHAGLRHDVRAKLPSLAMPVLVTTGEHDPVVPPAVAEDLASRIPGARFHVFRGPRAWHAIPLEMADEFNALVLEFHGSAAAN